MTTLILVLFLSELFGGTTRVSLTFAGMSECRAMLKQIKGYQVAHVIEQDCAPAPEAAPLPPRPVGRR